MCTDLDLDLNPDPDAKDSMHTHISEKLEITSWQWNIIHETDSYENVDYDDRYIHYYCNLMIVTRKAVVNTATFISLKRSNDPPLLFVRLLPWRAIWKWQQTTTIFFRRQITSISRERWLKTHSNNIDDDQPWNCFGYHE